MRRKARKSPGSVAIDTVPLPDMPVPLRVRKGRVSSVRGRYYLTIGRRKTEIPVGPFVSRQEAAKMVGKEVLVAFSRKRKSDIVAIGTWPTPERPRRIPCYWWGCYIPGPDMISRIRPPIRRMLITKMLSEKIITPRLARELRRGIGRKK